MFDCAGEWGGDAVEDCGVCEGVETDPANCIMEGFMLSLANADLMNGTLDVVMNNEFDVAGFQFEINGVTLTSAAGGSAESNGFMVSAGGNATVVGFSLSGGSVPPGNGVLTTVEFSGNDGDVCLAMLYYQILLVAHMMLSLGDCYTGFGCMDMSACNYDPTAIFESECYYEFDCFGECGGSAVEDCLGECGGSAELDCNGDCDGSAVVDCNDECGGGAVVGAGGQCCYEDDLDACGVCFGIAEVPEDCVPLVELSFADVDVDGSNLSFSVEIHNTVPVAGWQFLIEALPFDVLEITGAGGGLADDAGHSISFSPDGTIVGFSLQGLSVPPSTGSLVSISAIINNDFAILDLAEGIFSDPDGNAIPVEYGDSYVFGSLPDVPNTPTGLSAELQGKC